jgi:small-conductance mechanosensitive channel/CRP-like cAMP-binding protein
LDDTDLLRRILLPPLLALGAMAFVAALRVFGTVRRLRVWAVLAGLSTGAYFSILGTGVRYEGSIRQALAATAMLSGAAAVLRLIDLVFWDWFLAGRRRVQVPRLLVDLFKLMAIVAVAIGVLKYDFGLALSGLLVTSTVVSAVIGLALQDMLANIAAGLGLQLEKPFAVGDWLLIDHHEGFVTQLHWRTLTIRTRDRHDVFVPNSVVARTQVINYSRPTSLERAHASVGIAYQHPPGIVKNVLARAAASAPGVAASPPVEVLIRSFGDFAIQYDVRFWITDFDRLLQITDDVYSRIWYEVGRAKIVIPLPARDVTMRTVSDEQEAREAEQRRREIFAVLRPLPVFASLSGEQIEALVRAASLQAYMAGEALVRQGDHGSSLFVIRSGRVHIEKTREGGSTATLDFMGSGDFFGEMSLLTGEPRTASIIADEETEVVVVSKEAFAPVLAADTGILVGLSAALEARMRNAAERIADTSTLTGLQKEQAQPSALLRRIGRFFGLDED